MINKKVGILTLHWADNYGALLQCYALCTYISGLGYDCKVINYVSSVLKKENKLLHFNSSIVKDIFFFKRHLIRKIRSAQFRRKFIPLVNQENEQDIIVVGSDQIWNFTITHSDKAYFGINVLKKSVPVISYAASMGQDLRDKYRNDFFTSLKNVSRISVREESCKKYITNGVDVDVEVVIDPVFLLSYQDWKKIIPQKKINQSYIFVYAVDDANGELVKIVDKVSEILNLDVICAGKSVYRSRNYNRIVKTHGTKGPDFFLYYLLNADYVVTSSFHGTAFSLVLQKQFVAVRPYSNAPRLADLLTRIDCADRLISSVSEVNSELLSEKINYDIVSKKINAEKEKSAKWLEDALRYAH